MVQGIYYGGITMSMLKGIIRPIYGTLLLQPLTILWCWLYDTNYWTNLGPFTIMSTIYLMPVYMYYEELWSDEK